MKSLFKVIAIAIIIFKFASPLTAQEVVVFAGLDETIAWLESENWWGKEKRGQELSVPHAMIVAISENWQKNAPKLPVTTKKEIFYRLLIIITI